MLAPVLVLGLSAMQPPERPPAAVGEHGPEIDEVFGPPAVALGDLESARTYEAAADTTVESDEAEAEVTELLGEIMRLKAEHSKQIEALVIAADRAMRQRDQVLADLASIKRSLRIEHP